MATHHSALLPDGDAPARDNLERVIAMDEVLQVTDPAQKGRGCTGWPTACTLIAAYLDRLTDQQHLLA
jgi:hypothetical protein